MVETVHTCSLVHLVQTKEKLIDRSSLVLITQHAAVLLFICLFFPHLVEDSLFLLNSQPAALLFCFCHFLLICFLVLSWCSYPKQLTAAQQSRYKIHLKSSTSSGIIQNLIEEVRKKPQGLFSKKVYLKACLKKSQHGLKVAGLRHASSISDS